MAREPTELAEMRHALGRRLAQFSSSASLTHAALAQCVDFSRSTVVNFEAGLQNGSRVMWERFDELLNAGGELLSVFERLSLAKRQWDRVGPVVDLVEGTFGPEARIGISETVSDIRDAAVRWLVSASPQMSAPELNQQRVGIEDVARLQAMRARLKGVDQQCGGIVALPLVADCVRHQVRPLLRGRYKDTIGDPLFRTAAQLALDAGWAAYDADAQSYARRCMRAALRLAVLAGDRLFGGRVLAALAHQSLHVGRNQEAVDLATAALRGAGRVAGPPGGGDVRSHDGPRERVHR